MPADIPAATFLTDFHEHHAKHDPDGHCWTFLNPTWTLGQAWDDIRRFAGALQRAGVSRGDRIVFVDKHNRRSSSRTLAVCPIGASNAIVN